MPVIEAHIASSLTHARKSRFVREIVSVTSDAIGSDPKVINVVVREHDETNMCISGVSLMSTDSARLGLRRRGQSGQPSPQPSRSGALPHLLP